MDQSNGSAWVNPFGKCFGSLSLLRFFFIPMAIWGGEWIYGTSENVEMERTFIRWLLIFGPFYTAYGALSGFLLVKERLD